MPKTLLIFLCMAAGLAAQDAPVTYTSVALFDVPLTKQSAFLERSKAFVPVLDKLFQDGVITGYGADADLFHNAGMPNVALWYDAPDYASVGKAEAAIGEAAEKDPSVFGDLMSMSAPEKHQDLLIRNLIHASKPGSGGMPVSAFDQIRVKPGQMEEYLKRFRQFDKPVYDKLLADGVILGYSLCTEALHTSKPGLTWTIVTMPDLGAMDKVRHAFEAARKQSAQNGDAVVEPDSHRDSLSMSVLYRQK